MKWVWFSVVCLVLLVAAISSGTAGSQSNAVSTIVLPDFSADFSKVGENAGYTLNGAATVVDGMVRLVPSSTFQAGSVFLDSCMETIVWQAEFDFCIANPNDFGVADGLTFAFINQYSSHLLGGPGGGLGVIGLNGYAVEFDVYTNTEPLYSESGVAWTPGDPGILEEKRSHVGISRTNPFTGVFVNDDVPVLYGNGWFHVEVNFDDGLVQVYLSNKKMKYPRTLVADYTIPGYKKDITAFGLTAATGTGAAEYYVDNFRVRTRGEY